MSLLHPKKISKIQADDETSNAGSFSLWRIVQGGLFYLFFFSAAGFGFFGGFWFYALLLLCFPASLLFCFSAFLLLFFSGSLLFMLLCFFASLLYLVFSFLLLCFPCFSAFLLLCFCAFLLFYYSTCSFLQSCAFAALLPAPLLLCSLSLRPLVFFCYCALFSSFCNLNETLKTLGETQRNPKEILIRTPDKKPCMKH